MKNIFDYIQAQFFVGNKKDVEMLQLVWTVYEKGIKICKLKGFLFA